MDPSRCRKGIGAGRAGAIVAIVAGLVALPPAFAGEDTSSSAPPPDADGILGNETTGPGEPDAGSGSSVDPPAPGPASGSRSRPEPAAASSESDDADPDAGARSGDEAKRAPCPNAAAGAETLTNAQIGRAIFCLVNRARRQRDKRQLYKNGDLGKIARKHSARMEEQNCFAHKCPGEPSLGKRVKRSGYPDGARKWRFAENLGCSKTAQGMIDAWLAEEFNKANLLNRKFRDVGVGVVHGSPNPVAPPDGCPEDDSHTATYTLVFAFRTG
jgi:uncharacterized protein YkwD